MMLHSYQSLTFIIAGQVLQLQLDDADLLLKCRHDLADLLRVKIVQGQFLQMLLMVLHLLRGVIRCGIVIASGKWHESR